MRNFLRSFLGRLRLIIAACFLLAACAPANVEMPTFEGFDVKNLLAEGGKVESLESTFYIEYEREGSVLKGDAVLRLTPETLNMRVYSLGFLVAEVTSNGLEIKSSPSIEKGKLSMLVDGIRNSFLWWSLKDPVIKDDGDSYRVSNSWRRLYIDKKTMLPEKQIMELDNDRQLTISYTEPAVIDRVWFPSKMRMELYRQSVLLRIKSLSLAPTSFLHQDRGR